MFEHSIGHIDCPACRSRSLVRSEEHLADMLFMSAFEAWLAARLMGDSIETSVRYIAATSEETYRDYAWALEKFFGRMRLCDIHDGHIRVYQDDRAMCRGAWKKRCGQNRIVKEVAFLLRILRCAGVWTDDLDKAFDQLPMKDTDVQRALEPAQQAALLSTMLLRPEWFWIHDYTWIALRTCISTYEWRGARIKDINLSHATLRVGPEASKNKYRNRTIPLEGEETLAAAERLLRRAHDEFGAFAPEHFVLPFGGGSRRGDLDVTRPMSKFGLKNSWNQIRQQANLPWLRPYDLRHTAITNMALAGTPIAVIQSFAGHIGAKMQQHYTTISLQAKRRAAQEEAEYRKKPPMRAVSGIVQKIVLTN